MSQEDGGGRRWTLLQVARLAVGALGVGAREDESAEICGSVGLYHVPKLDHDSRFNAWRP